MPARPNWKGYLKLSLVSCPVALYNATTTREKVSFHLLNRATGQRVKRLLVDAESGEPVERDYQVHGYEVAKGEFVTVEDEEIDSVAIESTHTMDVGQFVARSEVNDVFLDAAYYLVPDGPIGEQAFAVIREAMRKRKMAGIARIVLYRRERIVLLEPHGKGILATTLHFNYEIKPEADFLDDIPDAEVPDEMLDLAEHIIDTKKSVFDPTTFEDRYETALLALLEAKEAGRPPTPGTPAPAPDNVVNLMDALRRSVGGAPFSKAEAARDAAEPKGVKAKPPAPGKRAAKAPARKAAAPRRKKAG